MNDFPLSVDREQSTRDIKNQTTIRIAEFQIPDAALRAVNQDAEHIIDHYAAIESLACEHRWTDLGCL